MRSENNNSAYALRTSRVHAVWVFTELCVFLAVDRIKIVVCGGVKISASSSIVSAICHVAFVHNFVKYYFLSIVRVI